MANLLAEAVFLSFVLGGMLGAMVALHLKKDARQRAENRRLALVRQRSRPPR